MIIRHQRASASNKGFGHLARYIRGRSSKPRTTWFLAANLPGVTTTDDLELACRLVEAVHAQNTRAGSDRTYHLVVSLHPEDRSIDMKELRHVVENLVDTLGFSEHQYIAARHNDKDHEHVHVAINKIHPETFRIHSPAWDHQKLFAAGRALEAELELTPLRSMARQREQLPQRAADCEAHQGIDSFARWARKTLAPVLRSTELRSWDDLHDACGRFGVVLRLHGNGLVFEDAERGVRVKASCVGRELGDVKQDDVLAWDLMAYDVQPATRSGVSREFIHAARIDNLASCHAAITALAAAEPSASVTRGIVLYDHEEVGSRSAQGAASDFLRSRLQRLSGDPNEDYHRAIAKSFFISADMAHAVHPNYADRHDPKHQPVLGGGPVVKINVNQSYATDGESWASFDRWAREADVTTQRFVVRSDLGCGSTIGPITAAELGIRTVDVGNPMLSMHSCREVAAAADVPKMIDVMKRFFAGSA